MKLYQDDIRVRYYERTVEGYLAHVQAFLVWLLPRGVDLVGVRTDDLLSYQSALVSARKRDGSPYSIEYQRGRVSALKNLFRFLYRRGYVLSDPTASLELPRAENRLPRVVLSKDEAARILDSCRGKSPTALRDRAILETFYSTGIRASELLVPQPLRRGHGRADTVGAARQGRQGPASPAHRRGLPRDRGVCAPRPVRPASSQEGALSLPGRQGRAAAARGLVPDRLVAGPGTLASRSTSPATPSATAWRRTS